MRELSPITAKMTDLLAHPDKIDRILQDGAEKANDIAAPILRETMDIMGFWNGK